MIRMYNTFINENYYNSHGKYSTFAEIRDIEVNERENYTIEDFDEWQNKYNINDDDEAIWVTNRKNAYSYLVPTEFWYEIRKSSIKDIERLLKDYDIEDTVVKINKKDGFIIPESDDGDNGYLFVKSNK